MAASATKRPTTRDFTHDPIVLDAVAEITDTVRRQPVSDVRDGRGHQYVDLVMEGGGVLGISLVGYCHVLEQAGIRFHSVAGTSAGAINALFLQAVAPPGHKRSQALIREVANMPIADFQDGGSDARGAVEALLSGDSLLIKLAKLLPNISELREKQGINPGKTFHRWVTERLGHYGIATLADLQQRMNTAPNKLYRIDPDSGAREALDWQAKLALITTELGTARKVVFPQDAPLFYTKPTGASPADFVRASMSVPYFFQPFRVSPLPRNTTARAAWRHFKPRGPVPQEAVFVDGGLLSNFPISEFHRTDNLPPAMPTFGVKLGIDTGSVRKIDNLKAMTGALIRAMRFDADREFLYNNPDYRQLIAEIRTDGFHWLDFALSDTDKIGLFREGALAAQRFIGRFDWATYRASRMPGM